MKKLWVKALQLAEDTPDSRNRYVDLLRAVSILAVVLGHWIISAPFYTNSHPSLPHILDISPWTQWLTWLFQVMPIFFFVGGYSNYSGWEASRRRGETYSFWLSLRLIRLLQPVLPLLLIWALLSLIGLNAGLPQNYVQVASRIAIVPTWFLAVYILVVLFVPITYAAWKRYRLYSILPPLLLALILDFTFFLYQWRDLPWLNYLTIWLSVHQLGYAWREGLLRNQMRMLVVGISSLFLLLICVTYGPYPLSLVGVPGEAVSNTLPPKIPLFLLGLTQIGIFMSLETLFQKLLSDKKFWALVIIVNSMIMTVFLWHSTAMMLVIGVVFLLNPEIYTIIPGTEGWWLQRLVWISIYTIVLLPFLACFARFEQGRNSSSTPPTLMNQFLGCILTCAGIAYLAKNGFGNAKHWSIDAAALTTAFTGAFSLGIIKRKNSQAAADPK